MGKLNNICNDTDVLCNKGIELIEEHNAYLSTVEEDLSSIEQYIPAYLQGNANAMNNGPYNLQSFANSCEDVITTIMINRKQFNNEIKEIDEQVTEVREVIKQSYNCKKTMNNIDNFKDLLFDLNRYYKNIDVRIDNVIEQVNINKSIYQDVDDMVELMNEVKEL